MLGFAIAAIVGLAQASDHWAVLVAGSNTYANYRHQADVHHAYQIMLKNGIPRDQIILMSYDDIAQNIQNPLKGQLFNQPNGENVYFQDDISYSGADVTPEKFMAVLKGDEQTAGGPVLKTNSESKVFVFYADHGAPGHVCMPEGAHLYADEIQDALDYMYDNGLYSELVWYMEACESGSMFPELRNDRGVYAITATNATTSSWATYCGEDAVAGGVNLGSCLGDLFSVNWMQDTEAADITTETLATQFENVKAKTYQSPVQKFGDLSFTDEVIGDFEGNFDSDIVKSDYYKKSWGEKLIHRIGKFTEKVDLALKRAEGELFVKKHETISSREVGLHYAFHQYAKSGTEEARLALHAELDHRGKIDQVFHNIFDGMSDDFSIDYVHDYDCLRFMVNTFEGSCGRFSDYSLKYSKYLSWSCNNLPYDKLYEIVGQFNEQCEALNMSYN